MIKKIVLIALIVSVGGCAVQQTVSTTQPIAQSLEGYSRVQVDIAPSASVIKNEDFGSLQEDLTDAIAQELEQRTSARAVSADADPDLMLNIEVYDFEHTGGFARFMTGILSGKAVLKTKVVLSDSKLGKPVWQADVDSTSKSYQGIFGNTTSDQVDALAELIASEIAKTM